MSTRALNMVVAGLALVGLLLVVLSPGSSDPAGRPTVPGGPAPAGPPAPVTAPSDVALEAYERRVESLEHEVDADPENRARVLELARLLHDGHRVAESIPRYRQAVELDPDEASAVYDLSSAYLALGRTEEARSVLEDRLDRFPDDAVTLYNLGVIELSSGDPSAARVWWTRARETNPDPSLRARIDEALAELASGAGGAGG